MQIYAYNWVRVWSYSAVSSPFRKLKLKFSCPGASPRSPLSPFSTTPPTVHLHNVTFVHDIICCSHGCRHICSFSFTLLRENSSPNLSIWQVPPSYFVLFRKLPYWKKRFLHSHPTNHVISHNLRQHLHLYKFQDHWLGPLKCPFRPTSQIIAG